jgi:hypothetical protein
MAVCWETSLAECLAASKVASSVDHLVEHLVDSWASGSVAMWDWLTAVLRVRSMAAYWARCSVGHWALVKVARREKSWAGMSAAWKVLLMVGHWAAN